MATTKPGSKRRPKPAQKTADDEVMPAARARALPTKPRGTPPPVQRRRASEPQIVRRNRGDKRWYCRPDEPHTAVQEIIRQLLHSKDRDELQLWRALYLDRKLDGPSARKLALHRPGMRARFNVIRNACEVLHARVGRQLARPWIVTVAGDWKTQRKAKAMGRFLEGDWERLDADAMRRTALHDAIVYGTGCIKVHSEHNRVAWSRVWRGDLFMHPREEAARCVRTLYQIAFADREVLAEQWPDSRDAIENMPPLERSILPIDGIDDGDDLVLVTEAWHLPSGVDDSGKPKGGRHTVCIDGATLEDDTEWSRTSFPIAMLHATPDPGRIWGIGYPERMAGLQAEQNSLAELASDVARLMTPKYVFPQGGKLTIDSTSNEIEVWETDGEMPQILQAEATIMQVQQAAAMQRSEMYRIEGISENSAEGSTPANLTSGKAQLVQRDIETERHVIFAQNNERFTVELAKLHVTECEALVDAGHGEALVAHTGKAMLTELRYADVRLGDDPYHVRVYPVSELSNTPQGKLAQLNEMVMSGMISSVEARELYDLPDLDRSNDLAFAGRELARALIDAALDGRRVQATRVCDLTHLVDRGWKEHANAELQGASEDDLVDLRDLIGHAQGLIDQLAAEAQAKTAAAQPAAPMPPPPMPAPTPPMPGGPAPLQVVPQ